MKRGNVTPEDRSLLKDLLTQQRVLSLSVLVEDLPYVGLLPFALLADFSAALIHASGLARHTKGLQPNAPFGVLIHQPDHPGADPLQLPRVTLQGTVQKLVKDSDIYLTARTVYRTKFPQSAQTFELADFNLYVLNISKGRFVAAFGRIYNVSTNTLHQLASED